MTKQVEFWFEFGSTYSYPTAMRIESLADENRVKIVWRPFLLGPVFKDQGWEDSPFNLYPAKGKYMWRDLERICDSQHIGFQRPSVFPRNGLLATRVACRFSDADWMPEFVREIYMANFKYDLDISSREVVSQCISKYSENPEPILVEAETAESKQLLKLQTERAQELGIFGSPSFLVGEELFWGNDRLEAAMEWVAGC